MSDLSGRIEAASEGSRECVIWPRALDSRGRGRVWVDGRLKLAHRAVWEAHHGAIPAGKMLCHHCDNPSCVNLDHLYIGTHADNMRDMRERKRSFGATQPEKCREVGRRTGLQNTWARGTSNPKAKLTEAQVQAIRHSVEPTKALVERYGVDRSTIQRIRSGNAWRAAALRARMAG